MDTIGLMQRFKQMFEYWQTRATQCKYFDALKRYKKTSQRWATTF